MTEGDSVQFISDTFTSAQKNYPTIEKEAYLFAAHFTIYTDHAPLKCVFFGKEIKSTRIQCW